MHWDQDVLNVSTLKPVDIINEMLMNIKSNFILFLKKKL